MFCSDINQDGVVDGLDYNDWEADNNNFGSGYLSTDLNGDGIVDGLDFLLWKPTITRLWVWYNLNRILNFGRHFPLSAIVLFRLVINDETKQKPLLQSGPESILVSCESIGVNPHVPTPQR
ncbi:MAG: hypothetical protein HWD58_11290 [Bacteroidota bacterium]|nr:MAG: hypothetical protein HWD58_11290 [Bacteroidota bacterium]